MFIAYVGGQGCVHSYTKYIFTGAQAVYKMLDCDKLDTFSAVQRSVPNSFFYYWALIRFNVCCRWIAFYVHTEHLCLFCIGEFCMNWNLQNSSTIQSYTNWFIHRFLSLSMLPWIHHIKTLNNTNIEHIHHPFGLLKWCVLCCIHKIHTDHKTHERTHTER